MSFSGAATSEANVGRKGSAAFELVAHAINVASIAVKVTARVLGGELRGWRQGMLFSVLQGSDSAAGINIPPIASTVFRK